MFAPTSNDGSAQTSREDDDAPFVLAWVQQPDPDSDSDSDSDSEHKKNDDKGTLSTIMIACRYNEKTIGVDQFSQRAAEDLLSLQFQSDVEGLSVAELTERAQRVISALEREIPDAKHRWVVKDEETADICLDRGLTRRSLTALASRVFLDGLERKVKEFNMKNAGVDDGGSNDLTQDMSEVNLSVQ
jgi:hypothetical protein